jgi:FAD synthetase
MKKIMCFGTFDVLHKGHEYYLNEAKKLGDCLVVVIALDQTVKKIKSHPPHYNQQARLKHVQQLKIANSVILGNAGDKLKVIEDEKPNVICFGYDQKTFTEHAKEELQKRNLKVEVVRLKAFHPD